MSRRAHGSSRGQQAPAAPPARQTDEATGSKGAPVTPSKRAVLVIPHARLTLWIPRESLDVAKNEARLRGVRSPIELHPLAPLPGSEWQGVELRGEVNAMFETALGIERLVEEVDDCVLAVHVAKERAALLSAADNAVLKRISVASGARIYVPPPAEGADNAVTFEGSLEEARRGLSGLAAVLLAQAAKPTVVEFKIPGSHIGGVVGQKGQHLKLIVGATHVNVDVNPIYPAAPPPVPPAPAPAQPPVVEAPKQPRYRSRFDDGTGDSEDEEAAAAAEAAAAKAKDEEEAAAAAAKAAEAAAAAARPLAESAAVRLEGLTDCVRLVQRIIDVLGGAKPPSPAALQHIHNTTSGRAAAVAARSGGGAAGAAGSASSAPRSWEVAFAACAWDAAHAGYLVPADADYVARYGAEPYTYPAASAAGHQANPQAVPAGRQAAQQQAPTQRGGKKPGAAPYVAAPPLSGGAAGGGGGAVNSGAGGGATVAPSSAVLAAVVASTTAAAAATAARGRGGSGRGKAAGTFSAAGSAAEAAGASEPTSTAQSTPGRGAKGKGGGKAAAVTLVAAKAPSAAGSPRAQQPGGGVAGTATTPATGSAPGTPKAEGSASGPSSASKRGGRGRGGGGGGGGSGSSGGGAPKPSPEAVAAAAAAWASATLPPAALALRDGAGAPA